MILQVGVRLGTKKDLVQGQHLFLAISTNLPLIRPYDQGLMRTHEYGRLLIPYFWRWVRGQGGYLIFFHNPSLEILKQLICWNNLKLPYPKQLTFFIAQLTYPTICGPQVSASYRWGWKFLAGNFEPSTLQGGPPTSCKWSDDPYN